MFGSLQSIVGVCAHLFTIEFHALVVQAIQTSLGMVAAVKKIKEVNDTLSKTYTNLQSQRMQPVTYGNNEEEESPLEEAEGESLEIEEMEEESLDFPSAASS